jgi:L-arabinose isomerase
MDFMNLNQAAHGDREFGYIQTRLGVPRKTWPGTSATRRCAADRRWARAAAGRRAARLRLARFGDNMRDVAVTEGDKVEAELRFGVSVNTYGVNDLVAVVDAVPTRTSTRWSRSTRRLRRAPELRRGGSGTSRCATAPGSRPACGSSSTDGGFGAFTTNFEDLGGLRQLPGLAVQRLMADGYGFGGEGDWKTSAAARRSRRWRRPARRHVLHGGLHLPPRPGEQKILGAHMLEVCPSIAAGRPTLEIHPLGIGGREDPVRLVFDAAPGAAVILGIADLGERFRFVSNAVTVVPPTSRSPSTRRPRRLATGTRSPYVHGGLLTAGDRTTRSSRPRSRRAPDDLRR